MSFNPAQFASFTRNFNMDNIGNDHQLRKTYNNLRPFKEFFNLARFNRPSSITDLTKRLSSNLSHFSANYLVIFFVLFLYCLFTNWILLWLLIFSGGSLFLISKLNGHDINFRLFGSEINIANSSLNGTVIILSLIGLFFASPFSTLMWLLMVGGLIVLAHATFLDKPIETAFNDIV